jgi:hypothetical protein
MLTITLIEFCSCAGDIQYLYLIFFLCGNGKFCFDQKDAIFVRSHLSQATFEKRYSVCNSVYQRPNRIGFHWFKFRSDRYFNIGFVNIV